MSYALNISLTRKQFQEYPNNNTINNTRINNKTNALLTTKPVTQVPRVFLFPLDNYSERNKLPLNSVAMLFLLRSGRGKWPRDLVIVHDIGQGPSVPSLSPFPLKLQTFLRMANIPYQVMQIHFSNQKIGLIILRISTKLGQDA